ncbi:MAG: type III pantothenate kinase [bacterium]|nr:type III pantothenate kinase [bacterium]
MFLAVDIGNTSTAFGIFDKNVLKKTFRCNSDKNLSANDYEKSIKQELCEYQITDCLISSVNKEVENAIKTGIRNIIDKEPLLILPTGKADMKILTDFPETVGADRLANAYYAKKFNLPAIVIDIGTAITFDVVSKDGDFVGGVIMPGLDMQLKALNLCTSKLPKIELKKSKKAIGNTTESCILSGVIRGTASAIDGLIAQSENELKNEATIILTGGQYPFIIEYLKNRIDITDRDVTLKGICDIYNSQVFL